MVCHEPHPFQRRPGSAALLASGCATVRGDRATTEIPAPRRAVGAVSSRREDRGLRRSLPASPHTTVDRALRVGGAPLRLPRLAVRFLGCVRRDTCTRRGGGVAARGPALAAGRTGGGPRHGVLGPRDTTRSTRFDPRSRRSVVRNRGAAHLGRAGLGGIASGQLSGRGAFPLRACRDVRSRRGGRGPSVRRGARRLVVHHVLRALFRQSGGSRSGDGSPPTGAASPPDLPPRRAVPPEPSDRVHRGRRRPT